MIVHNIGIDSCAYGNRSNQTKRSISDLNEWMNEKSVFAE